MSAQIDALSVRGYRDSDFEALRAVRDTAILRVNIAHYSDEQVRAWASRPWDRRRFENRWAWVAEASGRVAGFIDLTHDGLIDRLFVHADHQRLGLAQLLYDTLELESRRAGLQRLRVEASHAARGFFERQGFAVDLANTVDIDGVRLENWLMSKPL